MSQSNESRILEKIRRLSPARIAEVEDFVDFLAARNEGADLTRAASTASLPAFAAVWDNEEDAVYDAL